MTAPTAFEAAVIRIIGAALNGIADSDTVRCAVIQRVQDATGRQPHPAAVACNITKFAWKRTYVLRGHSSAGPFLCLTDAGKAWLAKNP